MNALYEVIGISKQAVYQYARRQRLYDEKVMLLLREAEELRKEHPGCGVEKMYYTLAPDFIGRDRFIELFMDLGFRLKKQKNYRKTTIGSKVYYPNLIQGMLLHSPSQVWQSDITYIEMDGRFYYAVFIIDIYTKEIVGHNVSDSLRATANLEALKKALKKHKAPMIHHSDKGSQYIYKAYISGLNKKGCQISMCDSALDNAYAERINQTIKNEYINRWKPQNYKQLKKMMDKAVEHYNTQRPHNAIGRKTPMEFRKQMSIFAVQERPKVIIYADGYRKPERGIEPPLEVCKSSLQAPNCPIVISQTKNSKSNLNSVNTI
ncbi:IS3 family transposase [Ornithobacterium rhinotracheale]